jgi:hypothetical protein
VRTINRELPLESEIPLDARVCVRGNDRYEESARFDLLANRLIPSIPTPKLALVEPDFNPRSAECFANPLGSLSIL